MDVDDPTCGGISGDSFIEHLPDAGSVSPSKRTTITDRLSSLRHAELLLAPSNRACQEFHPHAQCFYRASCSMPTPPSEQSSSPSPSASAEGETFDLDRFLVSPNSESIRSGRDE